LKLSMNAFCVGLPGWMKCSLTLVRLWSPGYSVKAWCYGGNS
jgi:hypothetical protein